MSELILNLDSIANAIGWTLVHFLWQGALLFIAYWLITRTLCKGRVNLHYWIGMIFMLLCLIIPGYELYYQLHLTDGSATVLNELRIQLASLGDQGILSTQDMIIALIQKAIPYLVIFWSISVLLISSSLFKSWLDLLKLSKENSETLPEALERKFQKALIQLKLKLKPLLVISEKIDVPATFGYFKPVLLLPASLLAKLPQDQLEAILLHELCHIKRSDFMHNMVQLLVETLFFYNPLTKWISRDIRKVREQCCDQMVLKMGAKPMTYAKALTNIALLQNSINSPHLQVAANDGELLERIKFLILRRQSKSPTTTIISMLALSMVALLTINSLIKNTNSNDWIVQETDTFIEPNDVITSPGYSIMDSLKSFSKEESNEVIEVEKTQTDAPPITINDSDEQIDLVELNDSTVQDTPVQNEFSINDARVQEQIDQAINTITTNEVLADKANVTTDDQSESKTEVISSNFPKLIRMISPSYDKLARSRGIEGTVILSFNISQSGRVTNIKVDKSSPLKLLDGNARAALRKWRFDKNSINQNILKNRYQQIFSFYLEGDSTCIDGDIGSRLNKEKVCR